MDELPSQFIIPSVSKSDVDQQMALLVLEGIINPSRSVVIRQLKYQDRAFLTDFDGHEEITQLWHEPNHSEAQLQAIEQIVRWASKQSDQVRIEVFKFLDDPSFKNLQETLDQLYNLGIIKKKSSRNPNRSNHQSSLTDMILHSLEFPQPLEELMELGRMNSTSRRPEAAVRQALRRLKRKGTIIETSPGIYVLASSKEK